MRAPADGAVIRKLRPARRTGIAGLAFGPHHVTIAHPQRIERRPQALVEAVEIDLKQPRDGLRDPARADEIWVDFIGDGENGIAPDVLEIQQALRRYLQRIENSSDLRILVAAPLSHHALSVSRSRPTWLSAIFFWQMTQAEATQVAAPVDLSLPLNICSELRYYFHFIKPWIYFHFIPRRSYEAKLITSQFPSRKHFHPINYGVRRCETDVDILDVN